MLPVRLESLAEVFAQVPDPRKRRGVRHPMPGMLALVFLGLLARIREMAVLAAVGQGRIGTNFASRWDLTATQPPHATTISRAHRWLRAGQVRRGLSGLDQDGRARRAVDGRGRCQNQLPGHRRATASRCNSLTALVHKLKLVLGQWSVRGEKTNEPSVLEEPPGGADDQLPAAEADHRRRDLRSAAAGGSACSTKTATISCKSRATRQTFRTRCSTAWARPTSERPPPRRPKKRGRRGSAAAVA